MLGRMLGLVDVAEARVQHNHVQSDCDGGANEAFRIEGSVDEAAGVEVDVDRTSFRWRRPVGSVESQWDRRSIAGGDLIVSGCDFPLETRRFQILTILSASCGSGAGVHLGEGWSWTGSFGLEDLRMCG